MKIEIEIPDEILELMIECMQEYEEVTVTLDELKANPLLTQWFQEDVVTQYFEPFEDGLADCCPAEGLGYIVK